MSALPESMLRVHAMLDALARRERRLALLRAGLLAVAAWALGLVGLAALVGEGMATPRFGWAWLVGTALLGPIAGGASLQGFWAARERRRQAENVARVAPALRGELLTLLDRDPEGSGSPALFERVCRTVEERALAIPPEAVLPAQDTRRAGIFAVAGLLVLAFGAAVLPTGPRDALTALLTPAAVAAPPARPPDVGPRALVGDITLRYLYPAYTGLEPMEVPNSSGEVRAPPGTRVEIRARTSVPYERAVLEVYEEPPAPVEIHDGRDLAGSFEVKGEGVWRFRFGELPSPDYAVVPDPDLPPDVSVDVRSRKLVVAQDQPLPLRWTARDDYGITKVVVEAKGKARKEVVLREPPDTPRTLGEGLGTTAKELGLVVGDKVTLRVGAWDNDAVSGSKVGWSAPVEVEVVGPAGSDARSMAVRKQLRDALVLVLADFLLDPSPPAPTGEAVAAWATAANGRYEAFDELVRDAFGGVEPSGVDGVVLGELASARRELLAFARAMAPGASAPADAEAMEKLQAAHVEALEGAILVFDQMIRTAAAARLAELAEQVAREAEALQRELPTLGREAALARLDQLERLMERLAEEASRLGDAQLQEFMNARNAEIDELMEQVRKALAEGRLDDARALMDRLAKQLQDLAESLAEQQRSQGERSDALQKAMEQLQKDLQALDARQEKQQQATEAAREKFGGDMDAALKLWQEAEKKAQQVVDGLRTVPPAVAADGMPAALPRAAADALAEAEGLLDSVRARDLPLSRERVDRAESQVGMLQFGFSATARRSSAAAATLAAPSRTVDEQLTRLAELRALLDKLARSQSQSKPELARELQKLAAEQQQIAEQAQKLQGDAQGVARNLPMKAPGLERGTEQAAEQSGRAAEAMQRGDPNGAEGGQQATRDGLREAQDALQQAQENLRQMQQASRPSSGQGESGEGQRQDGTSPSEQNAQDILLPAPEQFQTPEEYRNALLEGMSGQVPDEYQNLNRRYYEELVRQ